MGQKSPIHINKEKEIINGYRIVDALKLNGCDTVSAIVLDGTTDIHTRLELNKYRNKTTIDTVKEIKEAFIRFPKRQGKRDIVGEPYIRDEEISASLNNRWKGDKVIKKLEFICDNDLEGDVLLKGIIEKNWKIDPCYEFINSKMKIDQEKNYGFTEKLVSGVYSISEVNKFIVERLVLDNEFSATFSIPQKANYYNADCIEMATSNDLKNQVDLIFTSIPYWNLKNYKTGEEQLGHERTKELFAKNIASIFSKLTNTLTDSANVVINIGETYIDGVGQGVPFLIRDYIEKYTDLVFKDTIIWSKKNPKPQSENVKRPVNAIEYLWWFVVDPSKAKYNMLTFPVEGKEIKVSLGAKDVSKTGHQSKKNKSISKPYGKIGNHLYEQVVENIITTSIGKDHELFQINSAGHPAPMSPMLPVTISLMLSDENSLICDPFGGSAVVGKIAMLLNRRFVGAELFKEFFDLGCQRLKNAELDFDRDELDKINNSIFSIPKIGQQLRVAA